MKITGKIFLILDVIFLVVVLSHSVNRDIQLEKQYPGDLRNRVVGSRLQKDGKLPYHYFWKPQDGIRYYDVCNKNKSSLSGSNITASPFFHELLYPICDLPQRTISWLWLGLEYLCLALLVYMACNMTTIRLKKWGLVNLGILFTWTEAWKEHIADGQMYIFMGLLIGLILFLSYKKTKTADILAAVCSVALVLCRPITLVLFIPYLFLIKKYPFYLAISSAIFTIYLLFILISPYQNDLYRDYLGGLQYHTTLHQSNAAWNPQYLEKTASLYENMEGFDYAQVDQNARNYPIALYSESGSFFVFYNMVFHKKMPAFLLYGLMSLTLLLLSIKFLFHIRKFPENRIRTLLFGFTLYMIVEMFSPIHRHQYNTVQWLPLVLTAFLLLNSWKNSIFFLLVLGLALNIVNFPWLLMRHTIGECCWIVAILLSVFSNHLDEDHLSDSHFNNLHSAQA